MSVLPSTVYLLLPVIAEVMNDWLFQNSGVVYRKFRSE